MGNLFGLPEQKLCPKCKRVLPKVAFQKYRRKRKNGNVFERLHSKCKECANKIRVEQQKKVYHTDHYKAIVKRSIKKRRLEKALEQVKNNEGATCIAQWHTCTECGRQKQYRKEVNNNDLCDRCLMWKDRRENGFSFIVKVKDVSCPDCGITHKAKAINTLCKECGKARRKQQQKKSNKRGGKSLLSRARKAGVYIEKVDKMVVYKRDKYRCVTCGIKVVITDKYQPNMATVDHIIPLTKGGPHTYTNVQTMCHTCNAAKSNNIKEPVQATLFVRC